MSDNKVVDIKGLLDTYEFPCVLPGSGTELLIRPITTSQMKKILAYENENDPYIIEEALDKLIINCVVTPEFNIDQLYLQDRFSLLLEIRKVTKGDGYVFNWKCPKCKVENIKNVLISELPVKTLNRDNNIIIINDKLSFEVDFPTRGDQKDAINRLKGKNLGYREKQLEVQVGTYANSVKKVHTPNGEFDDIPFEDKVYILENVTSEVFSMFTKWFVDHDFGVVFNTDVKCVGCGYEEKVTIPLSDFFV